MSTKVSESVEVLTAAVSVLNAQKLGNLPVAWPNREFTPPASSPYLRVRIVVNDRTAATLGPEGEDRSTGFLEIGVAGLLNYGWRANVDIIDILRAYFQCGVEARYKGNSVRITSTSTSPEIREEGRSWVMVTVYWESRLFRNATLAEALLGNLDSFA